VSNSTSVLYLLVIVFGFTKPWTPRIINGSVVCQESFEKCPHLPIIDKVLKDLFHA